MPTSPQLWAPLRAELPGFAWETPHLRGELPGQVEAVVPLFTADTVVLGHDMGGVVAAMAAVSGPAPRAVVLSGTALGPYWQMVRATAWPLLWRPFYRRHGGRRFVAGAVAPHRQEAALGSFPGADPLEMRRIAQSMRPPSQLATRLAAVTPVFLVWGREDRWYPRAVAQALARATDAPLREVPGGHFALWEEPGAFAAALREVLESLGADQ